MKISLDDAAALRVTELNKRVRELNSFAQKSNSALVEALVVEFVESASPAQIEGLANRMTSERGKQNALVGMAKELAKTADPATFKTLEKMLEKLKMSVNKKSQNAA